MYYFVPGLSGAATRETIKNLGLSYAFDETITSASVEKGPNGEAGSVLTRGEDRPGYYPDKQTWKKLPGKSIWFGWETLEPINYERTAQLPGEDIALGDGSIWHFPHARDTGGGCSLPAAFELQDDGKTWSPTGVLAPYQAFWRSSLDFAQRYTAASGGVEISYADLFELVSEGLSINYYVSRLEIGVMGIISSDPELFKSVMSAAFALGRLNDLQKKTS